MPKKENNYLQQYLDLCNNKSILLSKEMELAIKRVSRYLEQYYYDNDEALKRINFIENECSQTKGSNALLKLELAQKFWISCAFGFFKDKSKKERLIKEVPLVISRGSGKTTLAAAVGLVAMLLDKEYGADISCLASTRSQANLLYDTARTMSNRNNTLLHLLTKKKLLTSTKNGLKFKTTNSLFKIETSNYDVLDGLNSHCVIFDEVHTYTDDFIQVVKDGSSRKRENYQIWYITTNGTVRNGVFDKYFKFWSEILEEKIKDDSILPFIYKLDNVNEIKDDKNWIKAMPLLGALQKKEVIQRDLELAKDDVFKQTELITKTFNIPLNNSFAYFTNLECTGHSELFNINLFKGTTSQRAYCDVGIDLSEVNDICSVSFLVQDLETHVYHFQAIKIMPANTMDIVKKELKNKYLQWSNSETFIVHQEQYNTAEIVFKAIVDYCDKMLLQPKKIGYDKWNAKELVTLLNKKYGNICIDIPQNTMTLSPLMKSYKALIKNKSIVFDDKVSEWCHSNVVAKIDANNNVFPNKKIADNKIDVFVSNLIAYAASKQEIERNDYSFFI